MSQNFSFPHRINQESLHANLLSVKVKVSFNEIWFQLTLVLDLLENEEVREEIS